MKMRNANSNSVRTLLAGLCCACAAIAASSYGLQTQDADVAARQQLEAAEQAARAAWNAQVQALDKQAEAARKGTPTEAANVPALGDPNPPAPIAQQTQAPIVLPEIFKTQDVAGAKVLERLGTIEKSVGSVTDRVDANTRAVQEVLTQQREAQKAREASETTAANQRAEMIAIQDRTLSTLQAGRKAAMSESTAHALAFGAVALAGLLGISLWNSDQRRATQAKLQGGDFLVVSSAYRAAMTTICMIGIVYFGARVYRAGEVDGPALGLPWQGMAWVWCALLALGLIFAWIGAIATFWMRLGAPSGGTPAADLSGRWLFWTALVGVGLLPAFGMLLHDRYDILLNMLLVVVFAIMALLAAIGASRDEARPQDTFTIRTV